MLFCLWNSLWNISRIYYPHVWTPHPPTHTHAQSVSIIKICTQKKQNMSICPSEPQCGFFYNTYTALNDEDFLKAARNMFTIMHHSRLPSRLFINGHQQQEEEEVSFITLHTEQQSADGKKTKSQRRVFPHFFLRHFKLFPLCSRSLFPAEESVLVPSY